MTLRQVQAILKQEPFAPLTLYKTDGTTLDIPFKHVAVPLVYGLMVIKGVKHETSRQAEGYEVVSFDRIDRIVPVRSAKRRRSA
jgi:hypothetical protein